jgi:DNA processing protein
VSSFQPPDLAYMALSTCPLIGVKTFALLLEAFNHSPQAILQADIETLQHIKGIGFKTAQAIQMIDLEQFNRRFEGWLAGGIQIITPDDRRYPDRLRSLTDAPHILFLLGEMPVYQHGVAIVGTRSPDPISRSRAHVLGAMIASQGDQVISGLALGIDQSAHQGALSQTTGGTVAVLGNGILNPYPPPNRNLANAIIKQGGALICECPPDAEPSRSALITRNRLISGLSDRVVMVQSSLQSGTMHTIRFAEEQNRPLYTFNHPASGNCALIERGCPTLPDDLGK